MGGFLDVPANNSAVIITYDGGGLVSDYQRATIRYASEKREVKIAGICRSACVLALGYSQVCVFPTAVVSMHYATDIEKGLPRLGVTEQILQALPTKIAAAYRPNISKEFTRAATLTGTGLIRLGIKKCSGKNPLERASPSSSLIKE